LAFSPQPSAASKRVRADLPCVIRILLRFAVPPDAGPGHEWGETERPEHLAWL